MWSPAVGGFTTGNLEFLHKRKNCKTKQTKNQATTTSMQFGKSGDWSEATEPQQEAHIKY